MPYVNIRGIRIYYEVQGKGETIVLLHHGFGCTKMWSEIHPPLVEAGYRVVLYDRRGYGQSERGDDFMEFYVSERFRPESVGELGLLMEALGIEGCHLIGQCEGGVVSLDYAVTYPDRVISIALSSTQCFSEITMEELNREKFPKAFRELDPDLQRKFNDWNGEFAEDSFNQFRLYGGAYGRESFDLRPLLPFVQCPTLVLYPDRSFLFTVEQAVAFYRHLPRGELMVLPHCGHNTYEQEPGEYVRAVLKFLRRQKVGGPARRAGISCAA